jgi:acetyltransferase-like isoleucine patch superfamily enzyme
VNVRDELRLWREEPLKRVAAEAAAMRALRQRQFAAFGTRSIVHRPRWLYGTGHASIGSYCLIMHDIWLAVERSAWDRPEPTLVIQDGVVIRPNATISAGVSVLIEQGVTMGAGCGIYDTNHIASTSLTSVLDGPSEGLPVRIGAGAWLGDRVTVLSGADIGRHCVIGAGAVVRGTIPDHAIAVGMPARVVGSIDPTD